MRSTLSRADTRAFYNRISRAYDLLAERSEHAVRQAALESLAARSGEAVLEIGSGTGHSLADLAATVGKTGRVYGIDLADLMLAQASGLLEHRQLRQQVDLICGDASKLPFAAGSFDGVLMTFTLELFDTPEIPVVLDECKRVLKPGGRLAVAGMSKEGAHGLILEAYEWSHRHFPNFVDCRPIFVARAVAEAGFELIEKRRMDIWVPVEIVLARKT